MILNVIYAVAAIIAALGFGFILLLVVCVHELDRAEQRGEQ